MNCSKVKKDFCQFLSESFKSIILNTNINPMAMDFEMEFFYNGVKLFELINGGGIIVNENQIIIDGTHIENQITKTSISYQYFFYKILNGKKILWFYGDYSITEKPNETCCGNSEIKIVEENINIEVSETFTNFGTLQGLRGASAYEVYLETTSDNPKKTIEQWLESLKGESVKGDKGDKGDPFTFQDLTPAQVMLLKGADGNDGQDGQDGQNGTNGLSAYEVWKQSNPTGSLQDFYNSFGVKRVIKKLQTSFVDSTITPKIIADLSGIILENGKSYRVQLLGTLQTAATTTGGRLHWVLSGGAVVTTLGFIEGSITHADATTTIRKTILQLDSTINNNSGIVTTGVGTLNVPVAFQSQMVLNCTASGFLNFYFASEVAASNATLNAGTTIIIEEI